MIAWAEKMLAAYGPEGDGSLEYLGLVLRCGVPEEQRVYRQKPPEQPLYAPMLTRLTPFREIPGVRLCDYSTCAGGTARLVFRLPKDRGRKAVDAFFACLPQAPGREELLSSLSRGDTLLQLGVEFTGEGTVQGLKYYRRVNREAELWQHPALDAICRSGYKPIFLGVNDDGRSREHKLYFISKSLGFQRELLLPSHRAVASALGISLPVEAVLDLGLYLEGFALSREDPDCLRLYLRTLTR